VRFSAAFLVFIVHANYERFTGGLPFLWRFSDLGNDAVMVFFVLSGFVISYVANGKEDSIDKYFVSRFARLYSVVVPALILTAALDFVGSRITYELYDGWWFETSYPFGRFLANLLFVNEIWFSSIRPFSNGPFWSIGYEFWYYVLFAFSFYLKGRTKYLIIISICVLVGPKILILLPVWMLGVLVYRVNSSDLIGHRIGWILFLASIGLYVMYVSYDGQAYLLSITENTLGNELYEKLMWSKYFLSSYIIGLLVAANFIGFKSISTSFSPIMNFISKPIRYLASYTFVLYLLHYPLLQFFSALTFDASTGRTQPFIVVTGTLFTVWLLGGITEGQKGRYKKSISMLWSFLSERRVKSTG